MHKKNNQTGFTLIEIMLVLALMTAITIGGLSVYRTRMITTKIDKAALQIQQWLQGAQLFYIKNARWPKREDQQILLEQYLPVHSEKNPWGQAYEISLPDNEANPSHLFRLQTQVPDEPHDSQSDDSVIAQRIAGLLPNAAVQAHNLVIAEITIPGQALANQQALKIVSMEFVDFPAQATGVDNIDSNPQSGAVRIEKPSAQECPRETMEPHIYYSLVGLTFNSQAYLDSLPKKKRISKYLQYSYANLLREDEEAWYLNINTKAFKNATYINHSGRLFVIKTCDGKAMAEDQLAGSDPFLF